MFFDTAAASVRGHELVLAVIGLVIAAWRWNRKTTLWAGGVWIIAALLAIPLTFVVGAHLRSFISPSRGGAGRENYLGDVSPLGAPFIAFALAIPLAPLVLILVARARRADIGDPISAVAIQLCVVAIAVKFITISSPVTPAPTPNPVAHPLVSPQTAQPRISTLTATEPRLIQAVAHRNIAAARWFVDNGAIDHDGVALHFASALANPDLIQVCLQAKAPVDARDALGRTPLIVVVSADPRDDNKDFEAQQRVSVNTLIEAGANVNSVDNAGHSALETARDRHLDAIAKRLTAAGAVAHPGGQPKFRPPNK